MSLQQISVSDFTGGLNVDRPRGTTDDYSTGDNESPNMLNVEIDAKGGIYTRLGWERWNPADALTAPLGVGWDPKGTFMHQLSDGRFVLYVANNNVILAASSTGLTFANSLVTATANPHQADFASWGDTVYMACGTGNASYRRVTTGAFTALTDAHGAYNDDYTLPVGGKMPKAEHIEGHIGYVFVAGTTEGGVLVPNRLRWSHPDQPEDWASLDYIDIHVGGSRITGLKSFQDHLLIFKEDSIWALYGYNSDSWQLVRVSMHTGAPSPMAITRSENAVFFYSSATRGAIFAYASDRTISLISGKLRRIMEEIVDHDQVSLGFAGHRLWACLPWDPDTSVAPGSVLVFEPSLESWVLHRPALGRLAVVVEDSDVYHTHPMGIVHGNSGASAVMELHKTTDAATDKILESGVATAFDTRFRTGWIHAGWPERRKSWRRPRFMIAVPREQVVLRYDVFWDYNSASSRRSGVITARAGDESTWGEFDWGDGTLWGQGIEGSTIDRADTGKGLGVCRSIAIEFSTDASTPGLPWNLNEMMLKYNFRRFTT